MIILDNKRPLPDDPTPSDPPPSYEELQRVAASLNQTRHGANGSIAIAAQPSGSFTSPTTPPLLSKTGKRTSSSKSAKLKWFPFGQAARASQEIKSTVLSLVRDVVRVPEPSAAISILRNCAEACAGHDISFSEILQEKSVEGHTPIYWAVVKRPAEPHSPSAPDLVTILLSLAAPLSDSTLSEIRLACLQNSDQVLFQRLRRLPAFAPLSGPDEILLGATVPPDEVDVQDIASDEGAFVVRFRIPMFQKRMRVTKSVSLEFIARGRMWSLQLLISEGRTTEQNYEKGTWLARIALMEHSPQTWIDSQLIIEEPRSTLPSRQQKPKPPIQLRLKTKDAQLGPPPRRGSTVIALYIPVNKSPMGNSLQFDGCSYIDADGALSARLEAVLNKTEGECIIC